MRLSVVYLTCRENPRFDWFCDSLLRQLPEHHIPETELIFVDAGLWRLDETARRAMVSSAVQDRIGFRHIPPKDGIYQGPHRLTTGEYFSASNARNTGLAAAQGEYVVFVDDLSVLMPGWYAAVDHALQEGSVVAGAYQKHFRMDVQGGVLVSSRPHQGGIDSRWNHGADGEPVSMPGGWLFGASFGAPLETLLSVNGLDELCDSIGGEDYHLGLRLERAGARLLYDRRMLTIESEDLANQPYRMPRINRSLPEPQYMAKLAHFEVYARATQGGMDASFMILDLLYATESAWTRLNYYDLREVRKTGQFPSLEVAARTYWFDDTPLSEL